MNVSVHKAVSAPMPIGAAVIAGGMPTTTAQPPSRLDLPPGEARNSLLAVPRVLDTELPPGRLRRGDYHVILRLQAREPSVRPKRAARHRARPRHNQ
jgi:hypothetical protein